VRIATLPVNPNWLEQMMAWEFGGGIDNADGGIIVDQKPNVDAVTILQELWDRDLVWKNLTGPATNAAMKNGTIVSFVQPEWANKTIETVAPETKGLWRIQPMPALTKGSNSSSNNGGSDLVITKATKYPDDAWAFLVSCQMSVKGQMLQYEDLKTGLFPTWIPCYKQSYFDDPRPFWGGEKVRGLLAQIAQTIPPYYQPPNWVRANTILGNDITPVFQGKSTVSAALQKAKQDIAARAAGT
jgi:ABC-type glycerol-3-phosphate transport system substrate-binding protein